jgi:hypothetical protein
MKDDFGNLRFAPKNELLKKIGAAKDPVNLEQLVAAARENGIYLVARIVVFKDKELYKYNNHQFAVKDKGTGVPWRGVEKDKIYNEHWVDPYSEKVWEYNIEIAKELVASGFDEIQFDYIRFPTDGANLYRASYPHQDKGMDKESALISFLTYARENISTPISVDIYGANGWHRTSARTGQDVELLLHYVDVICPMYYPSHFSSGFLHYKPYDERPYRIYYQGSLRNYYIARKSVVIRPYAQAFKIKVSYDLQYYGENYIRNQVNAVDNSINMGYTFWNSGSKYDILLSTYLGKKSDQKVIKKNKGKKVE